MKKMCVYVLCFAVTCVLSLSAYAEENDVDKESEAKKVRIYRLENMQAALNRHVQEITADEKVTAAEMRELIKQVEEITLARKEAVAIYGPSSFPEIDEGMKNIAALYTRPILRHGARDQEKIKLLLAQVSGKDITAVEEDFQITGLLVLLLILIISLCALAFAISRNIPIVGVPGLLISLGCIMLLIAGLAGV